MKMPSEHLGAEFMGGFDPLSGAHRPHPQLILQDLNFQEHQTDNLSRDQQGIKTEICEKVGAKT